ncbi:NAPDH-dependent diflavin reductase [Lambiella insularis]|nr:NAPDH-dependent diflavin reductase [Lambiella insularis]
MHEGGVANINSRVATKRTALVLYGSETGNAHDVADELGRMTERLRFSSDVIYLDAIEPTLLKTYTVTLIAISTTGQGNVPDNARIFWNKLLRKKLSPAFFRDVYFAVFGLGDSSYPKYNFAARRLHRRLIQLGGEELLPRGEGDEQHPEGYDSAFIPWLTTLREHLLIQYPLEDGLKPIPNGYLLPPRWLLALTEPTDKESVHADQKIDGGNLPMRNSFASIPISNRRNSGKHSQDSAVHIKATIAQNRRITPEAHWQDVRHLIFTANELHSYGPGDILTIYPENAPEDVHLIMNMYGWNEVASSQMKFVSRAHPSQDDSIAPSSRLDHDAQVTFRTLLTNHLDLNAVPRRSFFALISHFTDDEFQKERLLEFTNPEYLDELYNYTTRPRRSILEVLQEFNTVKIPWNWAAAIFPELRGRQFSIASGGELAHGEHSSTRFDLLVAIVKYKTVIKKIRRGVCTRYLASLVPGTPVKVSLHKGDLGIIKHDISRPVVMVGPGTGVAPMRSLIWQRHQWIEQLLQQPLNETAAPVPVSQPIGESVLFFGCRNREADFFFHEEWQQLEQKMPLHVYPAFSRDQKAKSYVQGRIKEQRKLVYKLLHDANGIVYVCGSSGKMPLAVREALIEAFEQGGGMLRGTAEAYLAGMEKEGRYKQETW